MNARLDDRIEADDVDAPEPTLREQIEAAKDEVVSRQEPAPETTEEARQERVEIARGRDGKFARKAAEEAAPAPEAPQRAAEPTAAGQATEATAVPADARLAPQGWSNAEKALWSQIPEAARAAIARREADMHREITRHDDERTLAKQFMSIASENREVLDRTGVHPLRVFQDFMGIMKTLQSNDTQAKFNLLRDVAQRNGLDMRSIVGLPPGADSNPSTAPASGSAPIPPELQQMSREWQEFRTQQARESAERAEKAQAETLNEIMAFRSKPEAQFFDVVKDQMVALLTMGQASTLEDAYEQACWMRPDIRDIRLSEKTAEQAAAAKRQSQAKAARMKGVSVRGGSGSAPATPASGGSVRDDLLAATAEVRSRV